MILALLLAAAPAVPVTPKKPVTDTYFSVEVKDDYRWLEAGTDPAVQKWSDAQNTRARGVLDKLPGRKALSERIEKLLSFEAPSWAGLQFAGGRVFGYRRQPPKPQPSLVVIESYATELKDRVIFDPQAFDASGATAMDFVSPSLDGKKVAISLSVNGSERGDVHVFDVDTGAESKGDTITGVNGGTAGGSVAWVKDGFFYTRYPRADERPAEDLAFFQQVAFHKLGSDPKSDVIVIKDLEKIAENFLFSSRDGKWVADLVQRGDGGEFELYLRGAAGWTKVASFEDRIVQLAFGGDTLYLRSKKGAPKGQVLALPLKEPFSLAQAKVLVPEGAMPIEQLSASANRVFLTVQRGGPTGVRVIGRDGKTIAEPAVEAGVSVGYALPLEGDDALVVAGGYLLPTERRLLKGTELLPTAIKSQAAVDLTPFEAVREECTSKDGTKVPLTIVRKKGLAVDGKAPTWLTGYGGFNISITPGFDQTLPAWLERGGVYAEANLRGGSEFGEAWHEGGMKLKKQNVFDDFVACAQRLIELKITTPKHLGIEGGSNGGLLMGAALTQHPELFRAVVAEVGYFDMLRFEQAPNGAFNTTEYGSVKNESEFKALAAYSPYQAIKNGVQYPTVLLMTGANDPRVDPFHSRKFAARLQSTNSKAPVLLRTSASTGHGMGSPLSEQIAHQVDVFSFLFDALK